MLNIFSCNCWPSVCLWINVYSLFYPFLNWGVFSCWVVWVLYIFWILITYQIYHLNISSPIWLSCTFVLSMISFAMQKVFSLMQFHLFCFAFVYLFWGFLSKKTLLRLMLKSVMPLLSSRCIMVSGLTFKSLIHFVIFDMIWDNALLLFFCMGLSSFPNTIYWREYPFSIVYSLLFFCHMLIVHISVGLFLISQF